MFFIAAVVVAKATCLTMSNRGLQNSSRQRAECTPAVSNSLKDHISYCVIWFGSIPILRENTLEVTKGFATRRLFRVTPISTAKELYTYKHPCLLLDSNPGPTTQQVSATNHKTGRMTLIGLKVSIRGCQLMLNPGEGVTLLTLRYLGVTESVQ
ncbi:hypothetical protein TNCV_2707541 [Trichonephila clavipes]|nr:hypothetical protein TNCV_2707541 [Trichonephila clavipes]